ncbi:MAG: hypothetical protein HDT16_10735 [Oscillibacter sp.]|nr:hypothetical protein [Oscillibacter sp.]
MDTIGEQKGHSRQRLDLTGQQFGRLTVLYSVGNIDGRTAWLCRCQCGREITAKTVHLRGGHVKTCGAAACGGGMDISGHLTFVDGTCVEMLRAKTVRRNNTSGVPGVEWRKSKQRWRATICFKGKRHYLGSYILFEVAVKARKRGEEDLHDKFLREFDQQNGRARP